MQQFRLVSGPDHREHREFPSLASSQATGENAKQNIAKGK